MDPGAHETKKQGDHRARLPSDLMVPDSGQPGVSAGRYSPARERAPGGAPDPGRADERASCPGAVPQARWFLRVQQRPPSGARDDEPTRVATPASRPRPSSHPLALLPADQADASWPGHMPFPAGASAFSGPGIEEDARDDQDDRWAGGLPLAWERPAGLVRRPAAIAMPAIVLVAVAALALALLTGHGPRFGQLAASQDGKHDTVVPQLPVTAVALGTYPGQQQRGVFQIINRIVASGRTIVTIGSQTSGGTVRQQFFASGDGGRTWRLARVRAPEGGQPPPGHPAALLAGGPQGWMAEGPQAIWTSRDGLSWTLAATHGITPQRPGDSVWVVTRTARGFLAAGAEAAGGGGSQAVIWVSRDGLTWRRMTAAQLGLAAPGETVLNISYATWRGDVTVIAGAVARGRTSYDAAWLSTDGGSAWTRVAIPAGHGAGNQISGLGFDGSGMIAVRPGRSAGGTADGVAYFSPDGRAWQYAATIGAGQGWSPGVVKGSDYGFVLTGTSAAGKIVAYTSTGTGIVWQPTGSLGSTSAESVVSATVAPGSTVVAVGYATAGKVSQQPVFVEADTAGSVRPVPLTGIPGGTVPEIAVNSTAVAGGEQIAVGSADGYPAAWRKAPGASWALASSLSLVSAFPALRSLTSVTHGPAGWLAVGAPGPVILTSADGTTWQVASGGITEDLAGVAAVAAASGPAGYVIAGELVAPGGSCVADVWWSPDLTGWTRAYDVNLATGSSQVLAVAAGAHGFVSAGSDQGKPAVWTTVDGVSWKMIVLPVPAGGSAAVLQQVAIKGNHVAALGQATTAAGTLPFAELSVDGGATWRQVPFSSPGPGTAFTALAASPGGFAASGLFSGPGRLDVTAWTSATGTNWMPSHAGLGGAGASQITALAPSGSAVTGIASIATEQGQRFVALLLPAVRAH